MQEVPPVRGREMILCPVQGRDQGNIDESIAQGHHQGRETGERSADGLDQFRAVLTRVRVPHIEGKNIVKTKIETGKGPKARSAGKRNDVKRRRRKKRYAQYTRSFDDF
jgi:hypothetical protein